MENHRYLISLKTPGADYIESDFASRVIPESSSHNLRLLRVRTGYDYYGYTMSGFTINAQNPQAVSEIKEILKTYETRISKVDKLRFIVTDGDLIDDVEDPDFDMLCVLKPGNATLWGSGGKTADAYIDVESRSLLSCLTSDIISDIAVANSPSVQNLIERSSVANDFQKRKESKRDLAIKLAEQPGSLLHGKLAPDAGYTSFFSVCRRRSSLSMEPSEVTAVAEAWDAYLLDNFVDFFLNADDATRFVDRALIRSSKNLERSRLGANLDGTRLHKQLSTRDIVPTTGLYCLMIVTRRSSSVHDDIKGQLHALFSTQGLRDRFKIVPQANYKDFIPLIERGFVTPLRLFLKAPS